MFVSMPKPLFTVEQIGTGFPLTHSVAMWPSVIKAKWCRVTMTRPRQGRPCIASVAGVPHATMETTHEWAIPSLTPKETLTETSSELTVGAWSVACSH